tara:strand:+ start:160 stop:414 length:255 start_codon:yes stop_codon:yes gene_type:complete
MQETIEKKKLYSKYPYIYGWGRMMGSQGWYIKNQLLLAKEDNAPSDAIYRNDDGTWSVLSEVVSVLNCEQVIKWAEEVSNAKPR